MSRRNLVIAAVLAGVVAVAAFVLLSPTGAGDEKGPSDEASAGVAVRPSSPPKDPPASQGALEAGERSGGVVAAPAEPKPALPSPALMAASASSGSAAAPAPAAPEGGGSAPGGTGEPPAKALANKEDIRAAIQELKPQIKECFEQGLKTNPELDGTLKVEFTLARSPDGGAYAREGEVNDSTLKAPLVEACVLSKIQAAKFKDLKGDGEVRVRYPFRMSSDSAPGFGGQ
ncbi:MAG: AgmX/PglI C-terminal domain-containing protein [Myxococcales bacterium]